MATGLTHIWLLVADITRARDFYRETLGIELLSDLGEYVEFQASPGFQLALFTRDAFAAGEPAIPATPADGQRAVLAFAVEALEATCERLRARGVELASAVAAHAEWGLRTAFLRDPDGNLLCLYEDAAAASA